MELIKHFGIEPVLLIAQIVNFLIILFILKKFLYKPVVDLLKKRQDAIKKALQQEVDAEKKLQDAIAKEKSILRNAQSRAKEIIDGSTKQSKTISEKILTDAKKHSEKILKEAQIQIEIKSKETEKRLMENVSDVAIKFLQKALTKLVSEKQNKEIMHTFLEEMKEKS